jgi:hypothetical protein
LGSMLPRIPADGQTAIAEILSCGSWEACMHAKSNGHAPPEEWRERLSATFSSHWHFKPVEAGQAGTEAVIQVCQWEHVFCRHNRFDLADESPQCW